MTTLLVRVLPPSPLARRLSAQSILFAVGGGAFFTGSAVFFTAVVGLSAAQVGLGMFFVLSCLIVLVTHDTLGWVTIALVWLGHVTVTGAELYQSAGHWGLVAELSDPERRGEYQGAARLGGTLGSVWVPAAYTFLAIGWGTPGWLLIAAVVVLATAGLHPATRAAQRFLVRDHSADAAPTPA